MANRVEKNKIVESKYSRQPPMAVTVIKREADNNFIVDLNIFKHFIEVGRSCIDCIRACIAINQNCLTIRYTLGLQRLFRRYSQNYPQEERGE